MRTHGVQVLSAFFAGSILVLSSIAHANGCALLTCNQANKARNMIVDAADAEKSIVLVGRNGERKEETVLWWGSYCHAPAVENVADATVSINKEDVNVSRLYIEGRNVGTAVGCEHDQPATLQ